MTFTMLASNPLDASHVVRVRVWLADRLVLDVERDGDHDDHVVRTFDGAAWAGVLPLSGVKQTCRERAIMSANDPKRTSRSGAEPILMVADCSNLPHTLAPRNQLHGPGVCSGGSH